MVESLLDVFAQMNTQCAPVPVREHLKVSAGLRSFDDAECVLLVRHVQIFSFVTSDLYKHT